MPYGPYIGTGATLGGSGLVASLQFGSVLMMVVAILILTAMAASVIRKSRRRTVDKRP